MSNEAQSNIQTPEVQITTETILSSTISTTETVQTTKSSEYQSEKSSNLHNTTTTATHTTTTGPSTKRNSLDFGFRKCCKPQEILHLAPTGKPVCETLYGLELPPLVPQNMGHVEDIKIPDCVNGTLKIVDKFIQSPSESRNATTNNLTLAYKEEDFCNDFGIEDGSFITTVALVCERPQENICKEFYLNILNYLEGRELTLGCVLYWSQKFYFTFSFVFFDTLRTVGNKS